MTNKSKLKLQGVSEEFLNNSGEILEYCLSGLKDLERIIVSTPSELSETTRGYLLPIIYAYWERFFKSVFREYLRSIEMAKVELGDVHPELITLGIKNRLLQYSKKNKINELYQIVEKLNLSEIKISITKILAQLDQPLSFPEDIKWIDTESNVSGKVLEKICNKFKVDFSSISSQLQEKELHVYPKLQELVDSRNDIAHGAEFKEVSSEAWIAHKDFVTELMYVLLSTLLEHLKESQTILKNS